MLLEEGRVVPVIGRELITVGVGETTEPYERYLARALADYHGVSAEGLPDGAELDAVAERCLAAPDANRQLVYAALKTLVSRSEPPPVPQTLRKLAAITDIRLFLSTTFDSMMGRALDEVRFEGRQGTEVLSYSPDERQDLPRDFEALDHPCVYHLLGRLSARPSYVVTSEDLLEFVHSLQSDTRQPERLFDLLNRCSLLVLGSNFGGWLARFFIRMARGERLMRARNSIDYVVDTVLSRDAALVYFLRRQASGIEVVDDLDATEFVNELHRRWQERASDRPREAELSGWVERENRKTVFISYNHDDEEAARRLGEALETRVDVFFDRTDLEAGDQWDRRLARAIRHSILFIPVVSRNTLGPRRRYFRREWELAEVEASKAGSYEFILPVIIDDTPINHPALPERFADAQVTTLPEGKADEDFIERVAKLYRDLQREDPRRLSP